MGQSHGYELVATDTIDRHRDDDQGPEPASTAVSNLLPKRDELLTILDTAILLFKLQVYF